MRGALYDLTNFSASKDSKYSTVDDGSSYLLDYETVLKRFRKSADEPYWYENELYSIPDTQSFYIMFYHHGQRRYGKPPSVPDHAHPE